MTTIPKSDNAADGGYSPVACSASWSPITSAPRDGSVFLAFVPHDQCGFVFVAVVTTTNRIACMMSGEDFTGKATEWMPLPEFPQNSGLCRPDSE